MSTAILKTCSKLFNCNIASICLFLIYFLSCFRLEQKWIEVTVDTQVDALLSAVNDEFNSALDSSPQVIRTMVFANTVEAVEAVADVLTGAGIECFRYHSDSSLQERTQNLFDFQLKGGVFVCTDAAARGLDVPNVSHVIQVFVLLCLTLFHLVELLSWNVIMRQ